MLIEIDYYDIEYGAHIFATPSYTRTEIVDVENFDKLKKYIESQKDLHGCKFKKTKNKEDNFGYDYISNQGGVKIKKYKKKKIKIKKI